MVLQERFFRYDINLQFFATTMNTCACASTLGAPVSDPHTLLRTEGPIGTWHPANFTLAVVRRRRHVRTVWQPLVTEEVIQVASEARAKIALSNQESARGH